MPQRKGQHHYRARLTPDKVRRMRAAHIEGIMGYSRLAREFGVGESTARDVCTYRPWRHVTQENGGGCSARRRAGQ